MQHTKPKLSAVAPTAGTSKYEDRYVYQPAPAPRPRNPAMTTTVPQHCVSSPSLWDDHNHDRPRHGVSAKPAQYGQEYDYGHSEKSRSYGADHGGRSSHTQTQSQVQTSPSIAVPGRARGRTVGNGVDVQAMIRTANAMGGSVNYVTQRYRVPEARPRLQKR